MDFAPCISSSSHVRKMIHKLLRLYFVLHCLAVVVLKIEEGGGNAVDQKIEVVEKDKRRTMVISTLIYLQTYSSTFE